MAVLHAWPDDGSNDPSALSGRHNRQGRRVDNPKLAIAIRDKLYETVNWSLGGCLIEGYDGAFVPGDVFDVDGVGPVGQQVHPSLVRARVVRLGGGTGLQLAAQFLTISMPAYDILEGILLRRSGFRIA